MMRSKWSGLGSALAAASAVGGVPAAAQQLTVVSFGGAYQEGQSKALFQPAAKALGITVKEETYTGIADLRLKVKAGAVTWDIVASGSGSAARAGAEGILEKLDYKIIDVSQLPARPVPGLLRRRRRVLDRAGLEHQDLRRQGPAELGRFLGREEIPRQALLSQGRRRRARAGADGRRRAAEQGLRGAVGAGRHRARDQEDQGAEAARRGVVVLGRAARAADEGRRGRHDHRLERPLRRRRQGRRQGRLHLQPGACSTTTATRIAKGAPNKDLAMKFLAEISKPQYQAEFTKYITYGPTNKKAYDLGTIEAGLRQAPALASRTTPPSSSPINLDWYIKFEEQASAAYQNMLTE